MRGTFLHNWLGDRILHKELWKPTRESLARAWLVGFPITIIPFLPVQSLFACVAALFVRGNLLLCIGLQFLSTPVTAPVHLPACYFVGEVVRGADPRDVWQEVRTPRLLLTGNTVTSLYVGAAVIGIIVGAAGYAIIQRTWKEEKPTRRRRTPSTQGAQKPKETPAHSAARPATDKGRATSRPKGAGGAGPASRLDK